MEAFKKKKVRALTLNASTGFSKCLQTPFKVSLLNKADKDVGVMEVELSVGLQISSSAEKGTSLVQLS